MYLAPCGTGKTYVAAAVIEDRISLNRRVYVLVPQVEIFDEWMRVLSEFGLNPGYINVRVYDAESHKLAGAHPRIPVSRRNNHG